METQLAEFIRRMPKIELHLHLEGSIRPETAIALMHQNGADYVPGSTEEVLNLYRFKNLSEFVAGMKTVTNHIQRLENIRQVASEMLEALHEQHVKYVEYDCAVQKYMDLGCSLQELVETLCRCSLDAEKKYGIQSRLIVNLQRSHEPERNVRLVQSLVSLHNPFVIGIGLSGDETLFPPALHIKSFALAKQAGLHRTVHAGEAVGAASIWSALHDLQAQRIDHGTRANEDPELVNYLIRHKIPLTQCLTSNVRLHVVQDYQDHPFKSYLDQDVLVSLNTDDPQVFGTTLIDEYMLAAETFRFRASDFSKIVLNGVYSSFMPERHKKIMAGQILAECTSLQQELNCN